MISQMPSQTSKERTIVCRAGTVELEGTLNVPDGAQGIVLFAHGSGSSRHSQRNRYVASILHRRGLATLLIDLLTAEEDAIDRQTRHLRFNIDLLAPRLLGATDWLAENPVTRSLPIGYFGASTGSSVALVAANERPNLVSAIVSRGGRPDLAEMALAKVNIPTLLIVGGRDSTVLELNQSALKQLQVERMAVVPGATNLFEEPCALDTVAQLAGEWFQIYLQPTAEVRIPFGKLNANVGWI
ncbi:MAG: alpha/beta hydrolase [Cyanobacteria bacterium P01_D01_bin.123]